MNLLGNRLLIEPIEPPTGTIEAPQLSKRLTPIGRVVKLGTGPITHPELEVGQIVHVDTDRGSVPITEAGRPHRIVSVLDVQLILPDYIQTVGANA